MKNGKVLLSVLSGISAGAILGVLFAPEKGSDIRKKMVRQGDEYVGVIKEKLDNFKGDVKSKFNSEVRSAKRYVDNKKTEVENEFSTNL